MKPFFQGRKGFLKNLNNPFKEETWNSKEWERGYNSAYFENLEKLNEDRKRSEGVSAKEDATT